MSENKDFEFKSFVSALKRDYEIKLAVLKVIAFILIAVFYILSFNSGATDTSSIYFAILLAMYLIEVKIGFKSKE